MSVMQWNEQAKLSIQNGFKLIPLRHGDKRPLRAGKWDTQLLLNEEVDKLPLCGFGLVCGTGVHPVYAFDLDFKKDAEVADTAKFEVIAKSFIEGFKNVHGEPITRIGKAPNILIPFRMSKAGIKKKKSPERREGHVEILGGGQYFVAYNIHPKTEEEYTWSTPPHTIKAEDLPLLSEADVEYLYKLFQSLTTPLTKGKKESQPVVKGKFQGNRHYTNREIKAFLLCLGSDFYDGHHDEWIAVIMAVHHETYGHGKEIARAWCKQSKKYDEASFEAKWNSFADLDANGQRKKVSTFKSLYTNEKYRPYVSGLMGERFTDAYIAKMFALLNKGKFIYNEQAGGWYARKKHLWLRCEGSDCTMAGHVGRFIRSLLEDKFSLEEWTPERREAEKLKLLESGSKAQPRSPREWYEIYFNAKGCSNARKTEATLKVLTSDCSDGFFKEADKIGCDERYLGDLDGITDLLTGKRVDPKSNQTSL